MQMQLAYPSISLHFMSSGLIRGVNRLYCAYSVWESHKDKGEIGKKTLFSYDSQPKASYRCGRAADALGR